jgi:hypothetical protein
LSAYDALPAVCIALNDMTMLAGLAGKILFQSVLDCFLPCNDAMQVHISPPTARRFAWRGVSRALLQARSAGVTRFLAVI